VAAGLRFQALLPTVELRVSKLFTTPCAVNMPLIVCVSPAPKLQLCAALTDLDKLYQVLPPVIAWSLPLNVTVPVRGSKVPPVFIQLPETVMLHEALEQPLAVASSVPLVSKRFATESPLPAKNVEVAVLLMATLLKLVPPEVVMMVEVAPVNVVVALGVKVPAVCVKF
jgi:hypothetical protein